MRSLFAFGLFWTSVAFCAVAQVYIIRSVLRVRQQTPPAANVPRSRDAVELMWAVLPAFGLATLLYFTWRAIPQ